MELEKLLEWDVVQKPIMLEDGKKIVNGKALVRSDNDKVLEVVNSNFVPFTNKQLYELVNKIADSENIQKSNIKIIESEIGKKISVILDLDFDYLVKDDVVRNQLLVQNSHGGFTTLNFGFGNLVMSCSNGMVIFDKRAGFKIYHNKDIHMFYDLNMIINLIRSIKIKILDFKEFSIKIAEKTIKNREGIIRDAIKYITGVDLNITLEQYIDRFKHLKDLNILKYKWYQSKTLERYIHFEMDRKGDNYWGLLNGFTYYTNHENESQPEFSRNFFITYGYGKIINDRAVRYIKQKIKY